MAMESRWFRATVRQENALGRFHSQDFLLIVTNQGGYGRLMQEAIEGIRALGFQTLYVESHSMKRECL